LDDVRSDDGATIRTDDFRLYNYGPMSKQIYEDLDALVAGGLIEQVPVSGQSWTLYRATPAGITRGGEILAEVGKAYPAAVQQLFETKSSVASVSFEDERRSLSGGPDGIA
jgi:hypothetical protein